MAKKEKSKLRELIDEYGIKNLNDVHEFVKAITAETIQEILEGELENELGYSKYDYKNKETENSRNGYSKKTSKAAKVNVRLKYLVTTMVNLNRNLSKSTNWIYQELKINSFHVFSRHIYPGH